MIKLAILRFLLRWNKGICIDASSELNYNVITNNQTFNSIIIDSKCNITALQEGCRISEARIYGDVKLGRFVSITGPGTIVKSLKESISIGSFTSIGQNVCIVDFNHCFSRVSSSFINYNLFDDDFESDIISKGPTVIQEDVWVGSNSVILPGVIIGRGSIIGGGSIVNKNVPSYSVVAGNPAKVIKMRFSDEQIEFLEKLKWWEWNLEKIRLNKCIFNTNIKELTKLEFLELEKKIK
jgi:virginiamycin A acetyltransferase